MREPTQRWGLNRPEVRQWLPVALLAVAFLTGAFARTILSPLPATATPESEEVGDAALAAVPDEAVLATALNSSLTCQRAADGSFTCTASDPDRREVQVLDAVTGDKVAKASPRPSLPDDARRFRSPRRRRHAHNIIFRVVDCAARVAGQ